MSIYAIAIAAIIILGLIVVIAGVAISGSKPKSELGRFTRRSLLNKSEKQLIVDLDAVIPKVFGSGARVLSQVA